MAKRIVVTGVQIFGHRVQFATPIEAGTQIRATATIVEQTPDGPLTTRRHVVLNRGEDGE